MLLVPYCDIRYDFRVKTMFDSCVLTPICFVEGSVLFMSIVFIYVFWCPTRFLYQMMFVSCKSSTMGATCGAETANPCGAHDFTPAFSGVRVSRSSVFCIIFCRSLFVLFLLVIVQSVLRFILLITPLISSNFSSRPFYQIELFFNSFFCTYFFVVSFLIES